ncbi:PepSY-associated TM helix domain-containing protein [Komagataeibacter rhaeticus]|nr:PepSY-associated TM helix domain-containing protein [Komagataeibacter rhaeticus]
MQGPAGILAVDIPAIGLLVAIGSGLVIHIRALLPDIVLLRLSATRLRAWLDAHLLTGVLFLPFMVMITYTGVLVHVDRLLPAIPVTSLWSQGRPVSRSTAIRPPHVAPSPCSSPCPRLLPC